MKVFTVINVMLFASMASAWSINGHLFVANIAQNLLEEKSPDSISAAKKMLTYFAKHTPEDCTHEGDHAFVETATFADDLKYHGEAW